MGSKISSANSKNMIYQVLIRYICKFFIHGRLRIFFSCQIFQIVRAQLTEPMLSGSDHDIMLQDTSLDFVKNSENLI